MLPENALFCERCGQQSMMPTEPNPGADPQVSPPAGQTQETMFCPECGKSIPGESAFCPECGYTLLPDQGNQGSVAASQAAQASPPVPIGTPIPSLYALRCPSCGSDNYQVLGEKGAAAQSLGISLAFGGIGNMIASSSAAKNMETSPLQYKCGACGNKYVSAPLQAQPQEMLATPCTVNFQRVSSFAGSAIAQIVYLNGIKVGPVKNGKDITFPTYIRYNTIFVTDPHGVAFKDMYRFEAQPGGTVLVKFKRKFQ